MNTSPSVPLCDSRLSSVKLKEHTILNILLYQQYCSHLLCVLES